MEPTRRAARKALLLKLALLAAVLAVAGGLALRGVHLTELTEKVLGALREAGPVAFFVAMAILPAVGVPLLPFLIAAGPAFGPTLGLPAVIALGLAACTLNMVLAYWLARFALRPWLTRLFARLGYRLPQVPADDTTAVIVLLRVTPGVPFPVQNYLLGLADTPVKKYLLVSCLTFWPHGGAWIFFGKKLHEGHGGLILIGALLLVALGAAAQLVRRHYARKQLHLAASPGPASTNQFTDEKKSQIG